MNDLNFKEPVTAEAIPDASRQRSTASLHIPQSISNLARRRDLQLIAVMLAIKALVLIFGAQSYQALSDRGIEGGARGWFDIWNRWDAPHYLDLAEHGYRATGEGKLFLVFFPLYPWLTRFVAFFVRDYLAGAFVVSTVASIVAGLLLYRLTKLDSTAREAYRALWFLFIYPTSYFLHIGYTESLFLALMLGSFLAARRERWMLAGCLGALAGLARVSGFLLVPALAMEAFERYRVTHRWRWSWLWVIAPLLGLSGYLLLNARVVGDPLAFITFQREHWFRSMALPWTGVQETIRAISWRPPAEAAILGVQELLFVVLGFVCTVVCWIKLRRSYAVWMTLNWALFAAASFIMSVPRYTLVMFPIYILFAKLAASRFWSNVITIWSILYLALFVSLFVQGRWAF